MSMTWQEAQVEREHGSASPASSALATCLEAPPPVSSGCGGRGLRQGTRSSPGVRALRSSADYRLGPTRKSIMTSWAATRAAHTCWRRTKRPEWSLDATAHVEPRCSQTVAMEDAWPEARSTWPSSRSTLSSASGPPWQIRSGSHSLHQH